MNAENAGLRATRKQSPHRITHAGMFPGVRDRYCDLLLRDLTPEQRARYEEVLAVPNRRGRCAPRKR